MIETCGYQRGALQILKVGSCPSNDDSVKKNTFVFFCIAFKNFYFLNLLLLRKPPDYAESCRFSFINFLCTNTCWNS